jgi:hypothetical protein
MATKTTKVEMQLGEPSVHLNVRSDDKEDIKKYWLGNENSNIGSGKLGFKNGHINKYFKFYRKDLACVQWMGLCNAFIEPDGNVQIDEWDGVKLTPDERVLIKAKCAIVLLDNVDFFNHEKEYIDWFNANAEKMIGMTPEEVIALIEDAGY